MKTIAISALLLVVGFAVFYFTPQLIEGAGTPCQAFVFYSAGHATGQPAGVTALESALGDAMAQYELRAEGYHHPELECALRWWKGEPGPHSQDQS